MAQEQIAAVAQQQQVQPQQQGQPDGLIRCAQDLSRDRARLQKIAEPSLKQVIRELDGTGLAYLQEAFHYIIQFRAWATEVVGDIDQRISALEDGETDDDGGFSEEELDDITQYVGEGQALAVTTLTTATGMSSEARARLEAHVERGKRILGYLEGDEQEGEGEELDPNAESEAEQES